MVNTFEYVVDIVVHCSYSIETCFCPTRGEFIIVMEVHDTRFKGINISVRRELVSSGGCSIVGTFCEG